MIHQAPAKFVQWMTNNKQLDQCGNELRYHSRSDSHSKALCWFVVLDLLGACPLLKQQAAAGKIVYEINLKYLWKASQKSKTIDLALGIAMGITELQKGAPIARGMMEHVILSCEAKTVMTEHSKSQPRVFDELGSSHEIVHQGDPDAIAAGITLVNIADRFASPLRQKPGEPLHWTTHKQPKAAEKMVKHLKGLPIREGKGERGFDAYATIVINCDNVGAATLWEAAPAPQPGDPEHYDTFIERLSNAVVERLGEKKLT